MTDPAEHAEVVTDTTTETQPGDQATETQQEQPGFGVMPMWDPFLEQLPEAWREQGKELIGKTEAQLNKELEKRAARSVDPDFLELYTEAKEGGISVDELRDTYNRQLDMQEAIQTDPAGFLNALQKELQQQVDAGALTLREGTKILAGAEAAVQQQQHDDQADLEKSPEQKRIDELEAKMTERDRREQEAQQEQDRRANQERHDAFRKEAENFTMQIEDVFKANLGDGSGGHATSPQVRRAFATLAAQYSDDAMRAGQPITTEVAIQKALADYGSWDVLRPKGAPGIPVGGGHSMPAPADLRDAPIEERMKAAVEAARRITSGAQQ